MTYSTHSVVVEVEVDGGVVASGVDTGGDGGREVVMLAVVMTEVTVVMLMVLCGDRSGDGYDAIMLASGGRGGAARKNIPD